MQIEVYRDDFHINPVFAFIVCMPLSVAFSSACMIELYPFRLLINYYRKRRDIQWIRMALLKPHLELARTVVALLV